MASELILSSVGNKRIQRRATRIVPIPPTTPDVMGPKSPASLNFDHLKDQEFALIKDLGQKRGSLYWLRGWEVFEQIKCPLLNSRGFCFLLPSGSALKIWGDGVSNDGG